MTCGETKRPDVSVVVVIHNMDREAPRTLYSLSSVYQRHIQADDYEVIVVDNGSSPAFDAAVLGELQGNFRLIRIDPAPSSPAMAINVGLAAARGGVIGVMIDGARIVTPGLLHFARTGVAAYPVSVVACLGWYLGCDHQRWSIAHGYDAAREDEALASIDWRQDGYRLFEIGALDGSSVDGWFSPIAESNAIFLKREVWQTLGGADERFDAPGGGLLNLDIFRRALELPEAELVILLGEGTFHQLHGGVATNAPFQDFSRSLSGWLDQYEAIRGHRWAPPNAEKRTFIGVLPPAAHLHFLRASLEPARNAAQGGPLGLAFDRSLWSSTPSAQSADPTVSALVELAQSEFRQRRFAASAAVARIARGLAPEEPAPQKLLAHAGHWLTGEIPADHERARFHLARATAYRLLGDASAARSEYCAALNFEEDLVEAHVGLSELRFPGDNYLVWLARLHAELKPETYLEIGVARGQSLACARPPTRSIGVDPAPMINAALTTESHIFCEESDLFFARRGLDPVLSGRPLALSFIDGLHVFSQSLKDFLNTERYCDAHSVVLLHDTAPLDEPTQRPDRQRRFYSGDVWKTVVCLKHFRPDLDIFTIATAWTGLTVVTGFNPETRGLPLTLEEATAHFENMPFSSLEGQEQTMLNIVPNNPELVLGRLMARGIIPK